MRPLYSFRNKVLLLVLLAAVIPVANLVILHYGFSKRLEKRISEDLLRVQQEERRRVEKTARRIMEVFVRQKACLLYTSPSPRDGLLSRMPSSA